MRRVLAVMFAAGAVAGCADRAPAPAPVRTPDPLVTPAPVETTAAAPVVTPAPTPPAQPAPTTATPAPKVVPVVAAPQPIATIDGVTIRREAVVDALMESHGLNMLLRLVQVEMARNAAAREATVATPEEVTRERTITLEQVFKDANQTILDDIAEAEADGNLKRVQELRAQMHRDNEALLPQLLAKQNMTLGEFALLVEANANLRKLVTAQVAGKLTEENVYEAFLSLYGENVRVRHIQLTNVSELSDAQGRLAAGAPFETVARELSRNPATRDLGGELLPFSREATNLPDAFKQVAFTLTKPGEVSEPVHAGGSIHLIQLIERIAPKAVRFEDVKDSVEAQLYDRWITERMKAVRDIFARRATENLQINDPVLAGQFKDRLQQRETEIRDREQITREIERERTQGTATPATPPQPQAPTSTEQLRPPATGSGSDTPDQ